MVTRTTALEETIDTYGAPEVFNTDQGSQFTSDEFISVLKAHHIRISMDGKGRWPDNVLCARRSLGKCFRFYNQKRRHQSLDRQTPGSVYDQIAARLAA